MNRTTLAGALAIALACLSGCATAPASAPAAAPAATIELHAPRAGLYTAGQPQAGDWAAIRARGVATVVNLRTPGEMEGRDEAAEVQAAGMRYVSIPVAGAGGIDEANARLLHDALAQADGPVLVHCASGNRAGGLLALMQARLDGVPQAQALEFGRKAGMASTEARVRELLQAPACATGAAASGVPEGCP